MPRKQIGTKGETTTNKEHSARYETGRRGSPASKRTKEEGLMDPHDYFGRRERAPSTRKKMIDMFKFFGRKGRPPEINNKGKGKGRDLREFYGRRGRPPENKREGERDPREFFGRRERAPSGR